ncbi:hypothetical protein B0H17DRAFT_1023088 [Mycena rosella]|uniref:Methyltransferase domain-containing protein n=1 Tax=Mycena rosella TaxID=1033263 RepID=A0AAD7C6H5_MYCRO|nr:hypothetical protein B0H17DRAFT_1023088 [Mycena rosella]
MIPIGRRGESTSNFHRDVSFLISIPALALPRRHIEPRSQKCCTFCSPVGIDPSVIAISLSSVFKFRVEYNPPYPIRDSPPAMSSPDDARSSPEDAPACTSQTDPVLPPASLAFLKMQTKIEDDAAHLRALQARALAVHPYPCIRRFGFARLKIDAQRAVYKRVLALRREVPGALVLDVGCCFGADLRKLTSDGFPAAQLVGSDLRREFWDLGHALFRSTPESFPVVFVAGDVFDPAFLAPEPPSTQNTDSDEVDLRAITRLSALRGRLAAIHTASLFHLLGEAQQAPGTSGKVVGSWWETVRGLDQI